MVVNVMVENGMDFIPIIGNMFDFIWKSNRKNIGLLEAYLKRPDHIRRQSNMAIFFYFLCFYSCPGPGTLWWLPGSFNSQNHDLWLG